MLHVYHFLIHAPTSFDLAIFMGLIVLKYCLFCPFSAKMQDEGFNFFMLSPAEMGHFFLNSLFFSLIKTQILSLEDMMNV